MEVSAPHWLVNNRRTTCDGVNGKSTRAKWTKLWTGKGVLRNPKIFGRKQNFIWNTIVCLFFVKCSTETFFVTKESTKTSAMFNTEIHWIVDIQGVICIWHHFYQHKKLWQQFCYFFFSNICFHVENCSDRKIWLTNRPLQPPGVIVPMRMFCEPLVNFIRFCFSKCLRPIGRNHLAFVCARFCSPS